MAEKKLYHLEYLFEGIETEQHRYYTNLKTLCRENPNIGKSHSYLTKLKEYPFKNNVCIIRKGVLKTRLTQ